MRRFLFATLLIVLLATVPLCAQAVIPFSLIGGDGNLYGASNNEFYSISPIPGSAINVVNNDTSGVSICLVRSDGTLLGLNGDNAWQFVKVSLSGQITPIVSFPSSAGPICPAIASDGNYYGSSITGGDYDKGFLYQLTAAGALNIFYNFTGKSDGTGPSTPPVEGSDGNLYFFGDNTLLIYNSSLGLSVIPLINTNGLSGSPQEGPNGDFFAINGGDQVVQISRTGTSTVFYTPPENAESFSGTLSNLSILDNQIAAVVEYPYNNSDPSDSCSTFGNYSTLQTVNLSGAVTGSFLDIGVNETNEDDVADSDSYAYSVLLGGNGTFYGAATDANFLDGYGQTVDGDFFCEPTITNTGPGSFTSAVTYPSIQMSLSKSHVLPGGSTTLSWDVENAYSLTMQQCYGLGALSGKLALSGSVTANAPSKPGSYISSIVCGGTETGTVTLNVGNATLALVASPTEVLIGNPVTLAAYVINAGTPAPTGTVKFLYGSTVIGTETLSNGAATFKASTTGLPAGNYSLTASYAGDSNYGPATSPSASVTLIPRTAATLTVSPASQTLLQGATASFSAAVTGSSPFGYPTGVVTFSFGKTVLGTATLKETTSTASSATFSAATTSVPAGTYTITAAYSGDANNLGSSSSSTVTITVPTSTRVMLTASPNPVPADSSFTLTATPEGKVTPTGTVIFYNGTNQLASTNLNSSGVATITVPAGDLAAGTYSLTAYYAGDSNNASGTSPALSLTVQ